MRLALAPQTREPTAAPPNPTARTLRKPIGSGGATSWWCRWWPPHGGRGLKPVESRAAWLMLVVVGCCQHKNPHFGAPYCIVDKNTYYVEVLTETRKIGRFTAYFLSHTTYFASSQIFHPLAECNVVVVTYFSSCDLLIFLASSETTFSCLTQP